MTTMIHQNHISEKRNVYSKEFLGVKPMVERGLKLYNLQDFLALKTQLIKHGVTVVSAIELQVDFFKVLNKQPDKFYIDTSNWIENLNQHRDMIHPMEGLLNSLPKETVFVCEKKLRDLAIGIFRHIFTSFDCLEIEASDSNSVVSNYEKVDKKKKFTDLNNEEINSVFQFIDKHLVGHSKLKKELEVRLKSFRLFNMLGEQKIFSMFLMGESGIGKTEVGRVLNAARGGQSGLCKISFGNYSSKESLNSLIGSPRGYIGSDSGELPMKFTRSDVGLILIDEFEKADNPVFNFF